MKICLNCKFYEPGAYWDCRETIQEPVWDKERANFCEYFYLATEARGAVDKDREKSKKARSQFEKLFRDE
ncbi:MAG: hypothetical protein AB1798_08705 [Spirochaetota bacterium]